MGRGTVALVWLVIALGIGAAYGMGVTDGRKRAEGVATQRERDYQFQLDQACKILARRAAEADALDDDEVASRAPTTPLADREPLARARPVVPPKPGAVPTPSALASQEKCSARADGQSTSDIARCDPPGAGQRAPSAASEAQTSSLSLRQ